MKASVVQHSGCTKYNRPCFRGPHQHQNKSPSSNRQGRPSERDMIFCLATEETCQSHADGQCQYQKAGSSSPDYDTEKKPYDIAVSDARQKRCAHQTSSLANAVCVLHQVLHVHTSVHQHSLYTSCGWQPAVPDLS